MPAGELVIVPEPVPLFVAVSVNVCRLKVAVTDFAAVIETVHEPVPVHAPLQPPNVDPDAGVGVSVTEVPLLKVPEHVVPQSTPAGELVTLPLPAPALASVSANVCRLNVAVTDFAAVIETTHEPVPVHAPLQPVNVDPEAAVAVSVTDVPLLKLAEQVEPQLMPAGELVTVPLPAPALVRVRLNVCKVNVAVTDCAALIVTTQEPVPVHAPLQAVKTDPADGVAVSVTEVPAE
jgi:hypothetical protein